MPFMGLTHFLVRWPSSNNAVFKCRLCVFLSFKSLKCWLAVDWYGMVCSMVNGCRGKEIMLYASFMNTTHIPILAGNNGKRKSCVTQHSLPSVTRHNVTR